MWGEQIGREKNRVGVWMGESRERERRREGEMPPAARGRADWN